MMTAKLLPLHNLMDSVYTLEPVAERHRPQRNWFGWPRRCQHPQQTVFIWIDHRAGPGSFADNRFGTCCRDCRAILACELETDASQIKSEVIRRGVYVITSSWVGGK